MEKKELLELVNFFNQIEVEEIDITTDEQRTDGQLVVEVIYGFEGKAYKTKPLFYMQPNLQKNAAKSDYVSFFEEESYWLDIDINSWPEGTGGNIENTAIPDMTDDEEFKEFLLKLVNMSKTGYIQKMMRDGRSNQYGFNLENNNHWHDLINLIKAVIKNKGNEVDKKYFSRLIFEWNSGSRVSLHTNYGNRKIISDFYKNIQSIKQDMNNQDSINEYISILKLKKQIILQGAPGTGKTFTAKQIAEEMTQQQTVGQYKLIQFHPAYTYEDFVRGIVVESAEGAAAPTYSTKNKVLAEFAEKALKNKIDNSKSEEDLKKESSLDNLFEQFAELIQSKLEDSDDKFPINKTAYFTRVEDNQFRYTGDNWNTLNDSIMKFSDIKNIHLRNAKKTKAHFLE